MPIIKSAAKRMRQNQNQHRLNQRYRRNLRATSKEVMGIASGSDRKQAEQKLSTAHKAIDKAAKKGIIHKNTAARKKSRLARHLDTVLGAPKKTPAKKTTSTKKPAKKTAAKTAKKPASKQTTPKKKPTQKKTTKS